MLFIFIVGCGKYDRETTSTYTSTLSVGTAYEVDCASTSIAGTVYIQSYTFSPPYESIVLGNSVRWINNDIVTHTVTSGISNSPDGRFNLLLSPAQSKCVKFNQVGVVNYYCRFFLSLAGIINVQ